jgi:hypothetical protein
MKAFLAASVALCAAMALLAPAAPARAVTGILPDPDKTPGAERTSDREAICRTETSTLRHWDRQRDDRILAEYGLPPGPHRDYEMDHLIPLCLGGADSDANLWPEPRRSIEKEWPAERKDDLEHRLCEMVCAGDLDVHEAQKEIADDWTESYRKRFPRGAENALR